MRLRAGVLVIVGLLWRLLRVVLRLSLVLLRRWLSVLRSMGRRGSWLMVVVLRLRLRLRR